MIQITTVFLLLLAFAYPVSAQVFNDTEDETNSNPTIRVPIDRNADTSGMANPPTTRRMPAPPRFSENYRSTNDTSPPIAVATDPQPGFPGASLIPRPVPAVNELLNIFTQAIEGKLNRCSIVRKSRNRDNCDYEVIVDSRLYPFHLSNICSANARAALIGCNYGNQEENSGCILKQAIMIGYCQ